MALQSFFASGITDKASDESKGSMAHIKRFAIIYVALILIFGQRLFFYIIPSDDYMRFWGDDNTNMLITNSARWAQALLNKYVFTDAIQILPYLHGLVGIFCFAVMGYLSALYWEREKTSEIVMITLLIAATPMFAHNLYFATNITAWLTLALGMIGFFMIDLSRRMWAKFVGFIFLVFSIANYQSIIQIIALLILFRTLMLSLRATESKQIRQLIYRAFVLMAVVAAAYILSDKINDYFLHLYHLHKMHRLAQAEQHFSLIGVWQHLKHAYTTPALFLFFSKPLHLLLLLLYAIGIIMGIYLILTQRKEPARLKMLKLLLWITAFALIPPIVNLPILIGVDIPLRAHFPIGWAVAGIFMLALMVFKGIFRTAVYALAVLLIVINSYYISVFYDGCARQTQADILRANTIVSRIRIDKNYEEEPIKFAIVGQKPFNVKGWNIKWQQPFDSYWAKYKIFKYFTDLNFQKMNRQERNEIDHYIIDKGEPVHAYPGKNSIVVYNNKAVLFLNPGKMNILINKEKNIKKIPLDESPDIHSKFDLYIRDNILFYYKKECSDEDMQRKFFLRIYPEDPQHTVINGRRGGAFQTWDFHFDLFGKKENGSCIAAVKLPKYTIKQIRTGQFGEKGKLLWDITYPLK